MASYRDEAEQDAIEMVLEFETDIIDQILEDGEASDDLFNDYDNGDSYHHETHVDKSYDLTEAAAILDQLGEHTETDYGLWDGLEPRQAISAQAAYTYGNAVMSYWSDMIGTINGLVQVDEIYTIALEMRGHDSFVDDDTPLDLDAMTNEEREDVLSWCSDWDYGRTITEMGERLSEIIHEIMGVS